MLEAQYAAFFTLAGIEWTYEPIWGEHVIAPKGWLPDFLIDFGFGGGVCAVEVKPPLPEALLRNIMRKIDRALPVPSSPRLSGPWVWITSGGLGHLGTDAEGNVETRVGMGRQRNGNNHKWEDPDLSRLLWVPDDSEVAPFGCSQMGFLWERGGQMEFMVDEEPWETLLPVGSKNWGDSWRKAVKVVREAAEPCAAPPNPRAWLYVRASDECPECGDDKTPGFMKCRDCATKELWGFI